METSDNFAEQDHFKQILNKIIHDKIDGKLFQTSILQVFQEVLEFAENIIKMLEESGQSPETSCQSGCSYCCYSQVKIIPIEALSIYSFIKESFDKIQISDLQKRISKTQDLTCGKTFEEKYAIKNKLPCIFLSSKKCSIYNSRPSICRSWNSLDSNACTSAFNSKDSDSEINSSPARNFVFGNTRELFQNLSSQKHLQSGTLQMHGALFDCFNISDPLAHWAEGDKIFDYHQMNSNKVLQ